MFNGQAHALKQWAIRVALRFLVWAHRDSGYIRHLRAEVPDWFASGTDDPNRWMAEGTEQLLAVLSHHGHSGGSIGFARQFFVAMASYKPWRPLTGEADEWNEVGHGVWQNRRLSSVFRGADGTAYDIDGRVFHDGDGCYYTNYNSRTPVTFPYAPPERPEIVDTTQPGPFYQPRGEA